MSSSERPDERVLETLVDSLYRQSPATTLGGIAVVAVMGVFFWDRQPPERLLPWLLLQSFVVCASGVLGAWYLRQSPEKPRAAKKWARVYTASVCALGGCWSVGCLLFFDAHDPVGMALLIVLTAGVCSAALLAASCHLPSFRAFMLIVLAPLVARCFAAGERVYTLIALSLAAYLLFSLAASRRLHELFSTSSELRFKNEDLAQRLGVEKERAEHALAAKSKLLAAASHDLRQPLHALGMFVELLDERSSSDEQRVLLSRIRASTGALSGLLNGLLDISRLDSDTVRLRREHFCLRPLFEQLSAEHAESARQKGLSFRVSGAELIVESDPELLARLVRNLLSNALRFTARGEIALTAVQLDAKRVQLSVADTGRGIPLAERSRVFEEFYQIGNPERDREQGLGLGLAIVRGLAKVLEHPVHVRSEPERTVGTELVVELPSGDAELASAAEAAASSGPPAHTLAGRSVLLIDDERDIRDAMVAVLEGWGCKASSAANLTEALALWQGKSDVPDLVLCDYRLPGGMTGAQALSQLEATWSTALTSAIITGDTSPERIREARSYGRPVLFKPVMPGKLRALLSALLHQAQRPTQASPR
jgi:two-component system, sensor histidine kinase